MNVNDAIASMGSDLRADAASRGRQAPSQFPTKSYMDAAGVTKRSYADDADYRLDLTLQNLLAVGLEASPDDIIGMRRRARFGDFRWMMSLLDEMMRLGPAPQFLKLREGIKSTQTIWTATPEEADEDENSNDPEDKAARLIRDVTEEAWGRFLPDLKMHLSKKFFYGIAACQVMWKPKSIENRWSRITDIRPIPARRFRLDPKTLRFILMTSPLSWDGVFVDELVAQGKLIFVQVGEDEEPMDQRGYGFQCLVPWVFEQFSVRWRGKRLQNFGMPPVMVGYKGSDPQSKASADALADQLSAGTKASYPMDGFKAELLAASGGSGRGNDPYELAIGWCERQYDKIILGHAQASDVTIGAGSRTSSADAVSMMKDRMNGHAAEIDNDLERQGYNPYVGREFGVVWAENHTPKTESRLIDHADPTVLSTVALNLSQAGAASVMAAEDAVEACGLKTAEDGETTFAGNVKGEEPVPAPTVPLAPGQPVQPGASATAQPPAAPSAKLKPPLPMRPNMKPKPGEEDAQQEKVAQKAAAMGDFQPAAKYVMKKRKGKASIKEYFSRRQRFAAASVIGGRPRIILTSFGHEHGVPPQSDMNIDVRNITAALPYDPARTGHDHEVQQALEAHPMTGAIYGGIKSRLKQKIAAGQVTGATDLNFGIGCEHGKHRSVYIAERLGQDLRRDGHDVTVVHRDATDMAKSGPRGLVPESMQTFTGQPGETVTLPSRVFATHIEKVKPKAVREAQARIAAHVSERLRAQRVLAEQRLAK